MATDKTREMAAEAGWMLNPRRQMGALMAEWRAMFRLETLTADATAAVAVALVALPLSLAIANASGVRPEVGLTTAVVGGLVVALFGGCRLQVSGPAAAMTFLVFEIITKFRPEGLIAATLLAGLFQLATGAFRLGRVMQFVPRPVVAGFLSGIGVTIICTQLPKILGYDVAHDEEGGAIGLLIQTARGMGSTDLRAVSVGLTAAVVMFGIPKLSRRLPAPLLAVLASTALAWAAGWAQGGPESIALLGELPRGMPTLRLPSIPWDEFNELFLAGVTIYVLASIESLLSAAVVDTMARGGARVDHDQELIGQGLGNVVSALFAGIPVTGVIARSATNVQSGARTRLSAVLHALLILVMMLALAGPVGRIPIAALAGVLVAVALRMIEVRLLGVLWTANRPEAAVFLVTLGTILVTDLIVGVPVGMVAAFLYIVWELSALKLRHLEPMPGTSERDVAARCPAVRLVEVEGPLFFGSGFHLRGLVGSLGDTARHVILDLRMVPMLDVTGAELLEETIDRLAERGVSIRLARPSHQVRKRLESMRGAFFEKLRSTPIHDSIDKALSAVQEELSASGGCESCATVGGCSGVQALLEETAGRG